DLQGGEVMMRQPRSYPGAGQSDPRAAGACRIFRLRGISCVIASLVAVFVHGPARAGCDPDHPVRYCSSDVGQSCTAATDCPGSSPECLTKRPNVILIVVDDMSWEDLPFFSPPAHWGTNGISRPDDMNSQLGGRRAMRPTLNRLEARLLAERELD